MINPIKAYRVYKRYVKKLAESERQSYCLYAELKRLGFEVSSFEDPTVSIGWALRFAKSYKVGLHGKALMEVCAAIEKEDWVHPVNPLVNQFSYGAFTQRPVDEIQSIFAFGDTIQVAVCQCLINARIAGVV